MKLIDGYKIESEYNIVDIEMEINKLNIKFRGWLNGKGYMEGDKLLDKYYCIPTITKNPLKRSIEIRYDVYERNEEEVRQIEDMYKWNGRPTHAIVKEDK